VYIHNKFGRKKIILILELIFLIFRIINPELIEYKYVPKYSKKNNLEVIFKRDKMVFSDNNGCSKSFDGVQGKTPTKK